MAFKKEIHAILNLYANIIKAMEDQEKACAIFVDFAKDFVTVNLDILLNNLAMEDQEKACAIFVDFAKDFVTVNLDILQNNLE